MCVRSFGDPLLREWCQISGMLPVDTAILDLTEWLCRRFQVLTGRTNVWLAIQLTNLSIIMYFVAAGLYFLTSRDLGIRIALAIFCGGLLFVLAQTVLKVPIETYENNAYRRVSKGLRNPRRLRDAMLRVSFLTLSVVLWVTFSMLFLSPAVLPYVRPLIVVAALCYSLVLLTTVVLYLLACDPLPPCPGKVTLWLKRPAPALKTEAARVPDS